MRYAVISDVHSNIEAFNAVLGEIDRLNIKDIISLGDIVGYGPCPEECLKIFMEKNIPSVMGNHEALADGKIDRDIVKDYALDSIDLNMAAMSGASRDYLKKLKLVMDINNILVVHGKPETSIVDYITTSFEAYEAFNKVGNDICVVGHTHVPLVFEFSDGCVSMVRKYFVKFEQGKRYILNPGSVGQPRDGETRSSFGILADDYFEIRRVKYDIDKTIHDLKDKGYPDSLYERIRWGV